MQTELAKLKSAKSLLRKVIQRKGTGLKTEERFETYPDYILSMSVTPQDIDSTGLLDYCEDGTSNFTVTTDSIRDYAFYNYTSLSHLILDNENLIELQGTHAFLNTPIGEGTGLIHVPASLLDSYKTAANWSAYASQFTSEAAPEETSTILVEHEESVGNRTVEWFEGLTIEQLINDNR